MRDQSPEKAASIAARMTRTTPPYAAPIDFGQRLTEVQCAGLSICQCCWKLRADRMLVSILIAVRYSCTAC